jgi:hypothetical protein
MPAGPYCSTHRPAVEQPPRARRGNEPHRHRDEYAVSVALRRDLDQLVGDSLDAILQQLGATRTMTREIGILRVLLEHILKDGLPAGDARALSSAVMPLIAEIGRALRTNEQIKDGERDAIAEAMKRVLIEHRKGLTI